MASSIYLQKKPEPQNTKMDLTGTSKKAQAPPKKIENGLSFLDDSSDSDECDSQSKFRSAIVMPSGPLDSVHQVSASFPLSKQQPDVRVTDLDEDVASTHNSSDFGRCSVAQTCSVCKDAETASSPRSSSIESRLTDLIDDTPVSS